MIRKYIYAKIQGVQGWNTLIKELKISDLKLPKYFIELYFKILSGQLIIWSVSYLLLIVKAIFDWMLWVFLGQT